MLGFGRFPDALLLGANCLETDARTFLFAERADLGVMKGREFQSRPQIAGLYKGFQGAE